jgi:hypothetical protein
MKGFSRSRSDDKPTLEGVRTECRGTSEEKASHDRVANGQALSKLGYLAIRSRRICTPSFLDDPWAEQGDEHRSLQRR